MALTGGGEPAEQEIADVKKPEEQHAGESSIPCPPDSPGCPAPDRAGDQGDAGIDDSYFRGGDGEGVGGQGFKWIAMAKVEICERGSEVEVRKE